MPTSRLDAARDRLRACGCTALLVGPGPNLRYLTGYDLRASERLTLLVVFRRGAPELVHPALESHRAEAAVDGDVVLRPWNETDDPVDLAAARIAEVAGGDSTVAVDADLRARFLLALQAALPAATWRPGGPVTDPLRRVKDPDEVAALRAAAGAIDRVHAGVPELLRPGRTERDVAEAIAEMIRGDHDDVGFVIVAAGENAASPHHGPGDRRLRAGDLVVVDVGGPREGYWSDCTRTYALGTPPREATAAYEILQQAQHAAVSAVAPGVRAEEVDAAARRVLTHAGLEEHFVHRTGHGIGLEGHEPPFIVSGNAEVLAPGMVFSVEPGIYLEDRYGARIEDIVAVTDDGCERLNVRPRDLHIVEH